MYVPQANPREGTVEDIYHARKEWAVSLLTMLNDTRVGDYIGWIGLPRCLTTHFQGWRPTIAGLVREDRPHLKLHALGMANGSLDEVKALKEAGVYSIDSSAPVWRGWCGYSLTTPGWDTNGKPCYFEAEDPDTHKDSFERHDLIMNNLEEIKKCLA